MNLKPAASALVSTGIKTLRVDPGYTVRICSSPGSHSALAVRCENVFNECHNLQVRVQNLSDGPVRVEEGAIIAHLFVHKTSF